MYKYFTINASKFTKKIYIVFRNTLKKKKEYLFIKQYQKEINRRARQREPSQKRLIATQLKPRKGKDIKWILIENIYSLFIKKLPKKTVYVFNQYPFNIYTFSWF